MKAVYPVVFTKLDDGYMAYVPDFDINTQGDDLAEAIEMARDAIGLMGIDMEDDGKALPKPSDVKSIPQKENELVSIVDIDFGEYRKAYDNRAVKKTLTIPSWLNARAEKEHINFSSVLQAALKKQLHVE